MNISFPYFFELVSKANNEKEIIELLQKYNNNSLLIFLKHCYDPNIKFLLPKDRPPFEVMPAGTDNTKLIYGQLRKLYLFVEGGNTNISQFQREMKFIEMLESVTPEEAELLILMKNKNLNIPKLNFKVLKKAFPNYF